MKYQPRAVTVTRLSELARATCPDARSSANGAAPIRCGCAETLAAVPSPAEIPEGAVAAPVDPRRHGCAVARGTALLLSKLSDGEYAALVRRVGGVLA